MLAANRPFLTRLPQEDGSVQIICSGCMATWISYHPTEDPAIRKSGEHVRTCGLNKPNPALAAPKETTT